MSRNVAATVLASAGKKFNPKLYESTQNKRFGMQNKNFAFCT